MSGRTRRGNNDPQGGGDGGGGEPAAAAAAPPQGEEPNYAQLILAALTATNNVLAGLGTALQNLPNDMAAALPAPPLPPPPPPAVIAGAAAPPTAAVRSPFRATGASVLDFHTKDGKKFYDQATRALFSNDELFDVEPERFQLFLNRLNERVRNLGMLTTGANAMVPLDPTNPAAGTPINLVLNHGQITLQQVRAWETTFVGTNSRNDQNSQILYDLVMNSLSAKGQQRVQVWQSQYHVHGESAGGCLVKIVCRESYLDSNATISTIRMNLSSLDDYVRTNGSDITAFNAYVQSQIDGLTARGETTNDLVVNLFKGYKQVTDNKFADYLQTIENGHEDGTAVVDAPTLMLKAVNFYKNKVTRNEWDQPTSQQKEVLALQAQVSTLEKQQKRGNKTTQQTEKRVTFQTKKKAPAKAKPEKPKWLTDDEKPKEESKHKFRTWNNAKWYWCAPGTGGKCEGKWRTHKPAECKGLAKTEGTKKVERNKEVGQKRKADALKLSTVNEALIAEQEDSDYEH